MMPGCPKLSRSFFFVWNRYTVRVHSTEASPFHNFFGFRKYTSQGNADDLACKTRFLSVSVIGEPNSGKSTFINSLVGSKVSIVTEVPHTTRRSLAAVITEGNTQIVVSDTPGVVNYEEGRRLRMDKLQMREPSLSSEVSGLIAVVLDVSNKKKRKRIHEAILHILSQSSEVPSILILNKIDRLPRKALLLTLSHDLLQDREMDVYGLKDTGGYSKFEHVFMVSSLTGDGIQDVKDYFLARAQTGRWEHPQDVQVDCSVVDQISEVIREKILMIFDKEIPWQFRQDTVMLDQYPDGTIKICKKLIWPRESQKRYVESKLPLLHKAVVADLQSLLGHPVELILSIGSKKNMTKLDLFM